MGSEAYWNCLSRTRVPCDGGLISSFGSTSIFDMDDMFHVSFYANEATFNHFKRVLA